MTPIASSSSLNQASSAVTQSYERVSSGKKVNSAADDAAGLAISEQFTSQNRGQNQAIRNAGDGISQLQTAEGALNSLVDGAQRIRELAVQSANGIYTDSDRELIDKEVASIQEQMNDTLKNAEFNGKPLFDSNAQSVYQVGPDSGDTIIVEGNNLAQAAKDAGLDDVSVATQEGAESTIAFADALIDQFSETAAEFGAVQNRFESRIDVLEQGAIDSAASRSRILDADIAKEASEMSQNQIREQIGIAVQAQANQNQGNVLQLLGS
jgi:flagellin